MIALLVDVCCVLALALPFIVVAIVELCRGRITLRKPKVTKPVRLYKLSELNIPGGRLRPDSSQQEFEDLITMFKLRGW